MTIPVLYGADYSAYTRIARLALLEKGVAHAFEAVHIFDPAGPPADYLARHPFARVPALVHDGFTLYETAAIARYIDEAFPGPPLQPSTPRGRARVAQIVGILDSYAYRPMVWDIFVERVRKPLRDETSDEARIAAALARTELSIAVLEDLMAGSLARGRVADAGRPARGADGRLPPRRARGSGAAGAPRALFRVVGPHLGAAFDAGDTVAADRDWRGSGFLIVEQQHDQVVVIRR